TPARRRRARGLCLRGLRSRRLLGRGGALLGGCRGGGRGGRRPGGGGWGCGGECEGSGAVVGVVGVPSAGVVVPLLPSCWEWESWSYAPTISLKISAGIVPPSTGAPPYSVSIGFTESAWPTQIATVMSRFEPTNQASPLFSVVPVLPHSDGSPV